MLCECERGWGGGIHNYPLESHTKVFLEFPFCYSTLLMLSPLIMFSFGGMKVCFLAGEEETLREEREKETAQWLKEQVALAV